MNALSSLFNCVPVAVTLPEVGQDIIYGVGVIGVVLIAIVLLGALTMIPDFFRYMRLKHM